VQYRDVAYIVPFVVQFWLFATPIAYPSSLLPESGASSTAINPMVGVVEGFRWALVGTDTAPGPMVLVSAWRPWRSSSAARSTSGGWSGALPTPSDAAMPSISVEGSASSTASASPAVVHHAEGSAHVVGAGLAAACVAGSAASAAYTAGAHLGAPRRLVRGRRGRGRRDHRRERGGQEHATEDPVPDHRTDGGTREIHGRVGSLLEVGTGFHPELTGRENIFLNGAIIGMTRREIARKFDEIVEFAEVARFIDTPVKRYSSGMYLRLAFAVAAHLEPEILIVDEVLAVGDAAFQKKCMGKMGDVAQQGGPSCS
jgi:energy-coupling factor transporter ATP-binding protein EcfA2